MSRSHRKDSSSSEVSGPDFTGNGGASTVAHRQDGSAGQSRVIVNHRYRLESKPGRSEGVRKECPFPVSSGSINHDAINLSATLLQPSHDGKDDLFLQNQESGDQNNGCDEHQNQVRGGPAAS